MGSVTKTDFKSQKNRLWSKMKIKICFLVETTFKMTSYLYDVQCAIEEAINRVCFYNQQAEILVAMVTYRDYKDCDQMGVLDWRSPTDFFETWDNLEQESRVAWFNENDTADVAGAVDCAVKMNWSDCDHRLVYHYGISPAHGSQFHGPEVDDKYPMGDPNGKDLLKDVHTFSCMPADYTFFRINSLVDTMLSLMDESYTGGGIFMVEELDTTETYISGPDSEEE